MIDFTKVGKVGDNVSDYRIGNGVITDIRPNEIYAIKVNFEGYFGNYTADGKGLQRYKLPSLIFANGSITITIDQGTPPEREPEHTEFCGLTLAQWKQVVAGGYLVQLSCDSIHWSNPEPLKNVFKKDTLFGFTTELFLPWSPHCRLYKQSGVKQIWFGGNCPVTSSTRVMVKLKNGQILSGNAETFPWKIERQEENRLNIIEYVYLEEKNND